MIKINLLKSFATADVETFREIDDTKKIQTEFVKRFVIFLIGPLGLYFYESYNLPSLSEELVAQQAEFSQLLEFNQRKEAIAAEISKYEEDKKRLNRQTQFLEKISKERLYPADLIVKIRENSPVGLWLNSIQVRGNDVEINGSSDTEKAISDFEASLASVSVLKNVKLKDVNVAKIENIADQGSDVRIRDFVLSAEYAVIQIKEQTAENQSADQSAAPLNEGGANE